MTTLHFRSLLLIALASLVLLLTPDAALSANGVMLDIVVHEILDADPVESAVIDSVIYPVFFDRLTTLRAGNFVVDLTAYEGSGGAIMLQTVMYVSGPVPGSRSDEAIIKAGAALVVDSIPGKGKSHYRARFTPHPITLMEDDRVESHDSVDWEMVYSLRARYLLPKSILPPLQFIPIRSALDFDFELLIDTLGLDYSTRLSVYLPPGDFSGWPVEPEYGHAIDPARYRVVSYHTNLEPRISVRPMGMAALYRSLGYAPLLLTSGVVGLNDFADYDVQKDRAAGNLIPLDSLARTIDYKRHDRRVADNHAASFVTWLINTHGVPHFKTLYERATDLSIHRAFWSVYGQTLSELETQWLASLKRRTYDRDELAHFAARAGVFHDYERHLELLSEVARAEFPTTLATLRDIGIAQGQLGRWSDAVISFERMVEGHPDDRSVKRFLAESQRAAGDDIAAERTYTQILQSMVPDPQAYLRLGEIQWEKRRTDSAATLWRKGLSLSPGPIVSAELFLSLGHYFAERKRGADSAQWYFAMAKRYAAPGLISDQVNPTPWIITAEALLGQDSAGEALNYLRLAQTMTDAPVDVGRIRLLRGFCYDKLKRREEAVREYDAVITSNAEAPAMRRAQRHINRPYGR